MKIIGLRVEKYIDKGIKGHNCDFEYYDKEFERHILFGVLDDNRKVKITLWEEEGECGSGWTTSSWGNIKVEEVCNFDGYSYTPKEKLIIDDILPGDDVEYINNVVFKMDMYGGDEYYPQGYYTINMDLFVETSNGIVIQTPINDDNTVCITNDNHELIKIGYTSIQKCTRIESFNSDNLILSSKENGIIRGKDVTVITKDTKLFI